MTLANTTVRRANNGLDPRSLVAGKYGEFSYAHCKDQPKGEPATRNNGTAMWAFKTEKAAWLFIKDYGGELVAG